MLIPIQAFEGGSEIPVHPMQMAIVISSFAPNPFQFSICEKLLKCFYFKLDSWSLILLTWPNIQVTQISKQAH